MAAHGEERRVLKENRLLLSRFLQENNASKFQQLLHDHPNYIHMHCNEYDGVSFSLTLLFLFFCVCVLCEFVCLIIVEYCSGYPTK